MTLLKVESNELIVSIYDVTKPWFSDFEPIFNVFLSSDQKMKNKIFTILQVGIIVLVALVPLLFDLPFRDNIYLSWEGAYRMYKGQMPFRDFGLPLGYGFWLFPTLSFYLFGPHLFSLIKIQVLINILSGLSFVYIIRKFTQDIGLITASILLFVVSFSFYNFWPWYNHTVIVFEFVSLALLLQVLLTEARNNYLNAALLVLSALFSFLSFFTKQDGGAFSLMICGVLLLYHLLTTRDWKSPLIYGLAYAGFALLFIAPVFDGFSYWFNYGQEPHYSRVSLLDFLSAFFGGSAFIKLYLLLIAVVVLIKCQKGFDWLIDRSFMIHLLLTLGILFQATILQVTSYVPADGNIYFHSFMVFFVLARMDLKVNFSSPLNFIVLCALILIWWSGLYWKYANRLIPASTMAKGGEKSEVVSMATFSIGKDSTRLNKSNWKVMSYAAFDGIKMPPETEPAIKKIEGWYNEQGENPKVLNMSELTPLAEILGYELEVGMPLWYHLNVAMFDKELEMFRDRIDRGYYDMVIFEDIPQLNNFYPFAIQEKLKEEYDLWFSFQAPREKTTEVIEVYLKRNEGNSDN